MEIELEKKNIKFIKPMICFNVNEEKKVINKLELATYDNIKINKLLYQNDRFTKYDVNATVNGSIICVNPALDEEIAECNSDSKEIEIESYNDYLKYYEKYSNTSDKKWISNILSGDQDKDTVIYEDEHFIMLPDMKWTDNCLSNMYYLVIVKRKDLNSLRNLTGNDIELLEHILEKGLQTIESKHKIKKEKVRTYIHYRPSIWHLHIHFNHIDCINATCSIDFSHQLIYIIQNLKLDNTYYQKVDLKVLK